MIASGRDEGTDTTAGNRGAAQVLIQLSPSILRMRKCKAASQKPSGIVGHVGKSHNKVQLPYSPYPDLMFPYKTTLELPRTDSTILQVRSGTFARLRYLAVTGACKSCRLSTGYEIQNLGFHPRVVIIISVSPDSATNREASIVSVRDETQNTDSYIPLDFNELENLPAGRNPLRSHGSSRGVLREFCHVCGAAVFLHSQERPDLIDVSAGLLQTSEGKRAEGLLEWWRGRCSFAEDVGLDRAG